MRLDKISKLFNRHLETVGKQGPLWNFDKTPWTMCNKSASNEPDFPNKFTTVFLAYERIEMLIENIKIFQHIKDSLESIVVVWNHPYYKPEAYQWPSTPFPVHVIRVPLNKLQSRFLPFDLIKTDAVLTVDDEVVPEPSAMELGFSVWNDNPDRMVGFVARSHKWLPSYKTFEYVASATSSYSLVLTGASFFHKYFLYAYTFELPHEVYTSVDELMNCEDIAMNMLSQQISEKGPYRVGTVTRFACPLCKGGLSRKKNHYMIRSACITNFIHFFGYDPLKYSTLIRKGR
ncbi:Exostosin-like 3 [Taenia crassiceps]|uniref:Exostosin-like 3 n=1 Tax=Taenia crassiceps TaxID=6207 RepID=A0ABR4QGU6_9CEST